jgi:wyosine [tRNA(Phe)-imidazoG37] synthetase (radical SAM superfamily)
MEQIEQKVRIYSQKGLHVLNKSLLEIPTLSTLSKFHVHNRAITLDISELCNQTCRFCTGRIEHVKGNMRAKMWDIETFSRLLPFLKNFKKVSFAGYKGEPLLNPQISELLDALKDCPNPPEIQVLSNGANLRPRILDKTKHNIDIIRLSVYAASKETYDTIIENGNLERVFSNLEHLKNYEDPKPRLFFSFVAMEMNIRELKQLIEIAAFYNAEQFEVQMLREQGDPIMRGQSLVRHPELLREEWRNAVPLAEKLGIELIVNNTYKSIINGSGELEVEEQWQEETVPLESNSYPVTEPSSGQTRSCLAPFTSVISSFSGDSAPCCSPTFTNRDKFNIFNLNHGQQNPFDIFKETRYGLLSGQLPKACRICKRASITDITNFKREIENLFFMEKIMGTKTENFRENGNQN